LFRKILKNTTRNTYCDRITMISPFCEGKFFAFIPVPFVYELANTITSAALLVPGLMPLPSQASVCIHIARASFLLCSVGSMWYHATMLEEGKLFDEFPMIFIAMFNILSLSLSLLSKAWKGYVCTLATGYMFVTIWIDATHIDPTENAFRTLFTLPFALLLATHAYLYATHKVPLQIRPLYKGALLCSSVGCCAWLIDLHACDQTVAHLRLHGLWHICVSVTGYLLLCIHASAENNADIKYIYKVIPIMRETSDTARMLEEDAV
jgi:hypothetical protein